MRQERPAAELDLLPQPERPPRRVSQFQRESVEAMLRLLPLDAGGHLDEQRPLFEEFMRQQRLPDGVRMTDGSLGDVPIVEIAARRDTTDARVLYFHGGVFALGSARAGAGLAGLLARHARAAVLSVEYRLAPEHPFPAAVDDALAAYHGLLETGLPPARIAFAGESAGGGLAIAALVAARDAALPQPAAAVLLSPWVDLTLSGESMVAKADLDPTLTPAGLRRRVRDYAGTADPSTSALSPLFADLRGVAPLLIQVGSSEVLLDDATRLAATAAAADVAVRLEVTPSVPHVFQAFAGVLDEGALGLAGAGAFLREHLEPGSPGPGDDGSPDPVGVSQGNSQRPEGTT